MRKKNRPKFLYPNAPILFLAPCADTPGVEWCPPTWWKWDSCGRVIICCAKTIPAKGEDRLLIFRNFVNRFMDSKLWKLKKESPRYKWAVVAAGVEELNSTRRIGKWVKSAENW